MHHFETSQCRHVRYAAYVRSKRTIRVQWHSFSPHLLIFSHPLLLIFPIFPHPLLPHSFSIPPSLPHSFFLTFTRSFSLFSLAFLLLSLFFASVAFHSLSFLSFLFFLASFPLPLKRQFLINSRP